MYSVQVAGDSNSTANYRPISMLPFLSKMLEKLMCARLDSYLKSNNILCTNQFGSEKILINRMQLLNFLILLIHHSLKTEHHCCIRSETLVSDRRHMSELLVPGFGRPVLLCRD